MNKKIDAVVAGVSCLDITPAFLTDGVHDIGEILVPSKTVLTGPADIHAGGCVSNTGMAMAMFGADVRLMAKIGKDHFGDLLMEEYRRYTDADTVKRCEEGTSYSIIIAPKGIDRIFLHYAGPNDTFGPEDLDYDVIGQARLFHFGYPQDMRRMYENGGEEQVRILQRVREMDVTVSMDTCGVDAHSDVGKADWRAILAKTLPMVDLFMPSVEELCFMLDPERFESWVKRAGSGDIASVIGKEDILPLAEETLRLGTRLLLVKCGSSGLFCAAADSEAMKKMSGEFGRSLSHLAGIRRFEHSFRPKRVLSATGAGDTCIAAFLTSLLSGRDLPASMRLAAAAGAACCESFDALTGLSTLEELQDRIDAGWQQNG